MIRFFSNGGFFFKPPIDFKDDNLSIALEWQYDLVETDNELIEFIFFVLEELEFYINVGNANAFEKELVDEKKAILKEIAYPLYSYMTNRSFETKQFEIL